MEKKQAALVDLHYDILKEIMILVASSSDGAKDFAKAISVSKAFRQFVEDGDVLKAVAFDDLTIDGRWELFQLRGGLICRCAQAGQEQAQFILGKIILVSASQMLIAKKIARDREKDKASSSSTQAEDNSLSKEIAQGCSFLENFLRDGTCDNLIGYHFDFVKIFLSRARLREFEEMQPRLFLYMSYFAFRSRCRKLDTEPLVTSVTQILDIFKMACSFQEDLEPAILKVFDETREFNLQFLEMLEKQVGRIQLGAEERVEMGSGNLCVSSTITLVAKLDMLLKRLRHLKTIMQGLDKASLHSAQKGVELARVALSSLPSFEEVTGIMNRVQELKEQASFFQEMRTGLISKFADVFSQSA